MRRRWRTGTITVAGSGGLAGLKVPEQQRDWAAGTIKLLATGGETIQLLFSQPPHFQCSAVPVVYLTATG
jgi:hypothetical protein